MSKATLADSSLLQLLLVRYREFWREPEAVFWVFIFPVLLAAGLGLAFRNRPVEVLEVAVAGSGPAAKAIAESLEREPALAVRSLDQAQGERDLILGRVALLIVPGTGGGLSYRYDDTRPEARYARLLADRAIQRSAGRKDPVPAADEIVREPGSRYIDFLLPGLLGMNLMGSGIWSLGFAIVDARKKKLLKRLVASPMSRTEYLLSFLLSRLSILLLELMVLVGFGVQVFGVPARGRLYQLLLIAVAAGLAFSALGLLIASRARTIEAASGLMNLVMLPMWVLSGVFFSAQRYPDWLQPVIRALPLTATVDALRANMLEGAGLAALAPELATIVAWMGLSFLLAMRIFRWK
ncbi:MAG: ABC transporter permease [Acidobacteria bacterium]|nr:ABC transporter permease [Acidobacteriota bacterium]